MGRISVLTVTDISTAYGRRVLTGIGRFARQHGGWSLNVAPNWHPSMPDMLSRNQGVLVQADRAWLSDAVRQAGIPAVNVADNFETYPFPSVISDHQAVGRLGAEHLLSRGFLQVGFAGTPAWFATQRHQGFQSAVRRDPRAVMHHCIEPVETTDQPFRLWVTGLPKPVGIMACHDAFALRLARLCRRLNLRVPEDVAILGVDNDRLICDLYEVPLSSVAVAAERIGFEAAAMLARLLDGQPPPPTPLLVPPRGVVARQSTDTTALTDKIVAQTMQYIRQHARERIAVRHLVDLTGISRRRLEQRFLKALGRTPAETLRGVRLEQAKYLLSETDVPIGSIAVDCGFADAPRLTKVFRRELRMTPQQYRSRTRLR